MSEEFEQAPIEQGETTTVEATPEQIAGTSNTSSLESVAGTSNAPFQEAPVLPEPVKVEIAYFYQGQRVVERLGKIDADGAEECKLSDGTTAFVPKEILS